MLGSVGTDKVLIASFSGAEKVLVPIRELMPEILVKEVTAQIALAFDDTPESRQANERMECIRPLLSPSGRTRKAVENRAAMYGVHATTVYRLLARWDTHGRLEALIPRRSNGGRHKSRLLPEVDDIISSVVDKMYLKSQKYTMKDVGKVACRACEAAGLPEPSINTVRRRIHMLSEETKIRRRMGRKAAARFEAHPDRFAGAMYPLSIVEVDHTKLDLIIVDDVHRLPVGRPWITLAMDVYSRMVTGFYISLDPVGAISTGLCIAHSIMRKDEWLVQHGISGEWPCWGRMDCIHVDNAKEFRGNMLRRDCERYGIELNFRPVGQPHFGGHVERFFGTMMRQLHKLPGTTFSNVSLKGEYQSERKACLTFSELETFIAKWIVEVYHNSLHRGIHTSPIKRFKEGFSGPSARPLPPVIMDVVRLQRDFMPWVERTIQSNGVEIDYIHYYGPELKKWIGAREPGSSRSHKFIFARDPRDISRIFFFDPEDGEYREIPYLDTSRGPISLWELRIANQKLISEGREDINERLLFEKHFELMEYAKKAYKKSTAARRQVQRSAKQRSSVVATEPQERETERIDDEPVEAFGDEPIVPFDDGGAK